MKLWVLKKEKVLIKISLIKSYQTLKKILEPVQNKQENQCSIILIGGVHLYTDGKTTVHSKSNECKYTRGEKYGKIFSL